MVLAANADRMVAVWRSLALQSLAQKDWEMHLWEFPHDAQLRTQYADKIKRGYLNFYASHSHGNPWKSIALDSAGISKDVPY